MQQRNVVRVVLVSPSDVLAERDIAERLIHETSRALGPSHDLVLEPWRWEADSYPGFHPEGPQGLIDELMEIESSDLVVGIFWKRFGTPTADSASGTEHELIKAWTSWKATRRPQVMVYFSGAPAKPTRQELAQWDQVLAFKEKFPEQGMWWSYDDPADFERLFRVHLQRFVLSLQAVAAPAEPAPAEPAPREERVSAQLDPPRAHGAIDRRALLAELDLALGEHPIVVLGGLSGAGKTYLMAHFLAKPENAGRYRRTLWHDPTEEESLDSLLANLGAGVQLAGQSILSRCKALLAYLREHDGLLVIDNFHLVDAASYSYLLGAFANAGLPCRLVLLSQSYVASTDASADPHHVQVGGLTQAEARQLLRQRRVQGLPDRILAELLAKIGGLPFAIGLFALLVVEFGHRPEDLLAGVMENASRLRVWFDRILAAIAPEARHLLPYLTLTDFPFNIGVVRLLGSASDLHNVEEAFGDLQRHFLVTKQSSYRWRIHDLVATLSRPLLAPEDQARAHAALGHYFLQGLSRRRGVVLDDDQFLWKVRAYRQLRQSSAEAATALAILDELSGTAKARGHYALFLELSREVLLADGDHSPWIDYHHAHCALVLGHPDYCRRVIEPRLYDPAVVADASMRLSFNRLYAEALGSTRQEDLGLQVLRDALAASSRKTAGARSLAHARSSLAWLLTRTAAYAEAEAVAREGLTEAQDRKDHRGSAVGWTRLGILSLHRGERLEAARAFDTAIDLFRRARDRRGQAWTLFNVAECSLLAGDADKATACLREAAAIAADIGECSVDLRETLERMLPLAAGLPIRPMIEGALARFRAQSSIPLPALIRG